MIAVMDIPCYYGLNDDKVESHLVFSDDLISQFRADGAVVGQWTEVFNTSSVGPIDGAPGCVNAVSNYLDDALYYVYPNFRPAVSAQEMDDQSRLWIEAFNLMGVKLVPELYQGVTVPIYSEPTKTESSRIGDFYTATDYNQSPVGTAHIITAGNNSDDFRIDCNRAALGSPNQTQLFFNVYPNAFRDKNKLKLSGITADVAHVWIIIGGYTVVGDIKLYTSASVRVLLNTLDGDTVLHKDSIDGKEFNTLDIIDDDPYQDDPNEGGDKPGQGDKPGGKGDHDTTSDVVDFPDLPYQDILSTGLITLYAPSSGQVRALASAMFSQNIAEELKKLFSQPLDSIISLHMVPIIPPTGGSQQIVLGNIGTGVSAPIVIQQYIDIDFGSIVVGEFWGAFTDYTETRVTIFLPYIGFRQMNIQDVMGATLTLKYHVDVLTGSLQAMVRCAKNGKAGAMTGVNYSFSGNFVSEMPFTSQHFSNVLSGLFGVGAAVAGVAGAAFTGGMTLPMVGAAVGGVTSAAQGFKTETQRSGSSQTTPGSLGEQKAYIIIERPIQTTPDNFGKLEGYGSMVGRSLGSFNGFTQVTEARITISRATDSEKAEILAKLKQGVVV